MAAARESAVQVLLRENSKNAFLSASELILRLANNVLLNPMEMKYRRIRLSNPLLESKLLPILGGLECLFEMGFQEDGEYLTLPVTSSLTVLRKVRDELSKVREAVAAGSSTSSLPESTMPQTHPLPAAQDAAMEASEEQSTAPHSSETPASQDRPTQTAAGLRRKEADFFQRIQSSMTHVMMYEDPNLQQKARSVIPVQTLMAGAQACLQSPQAPFSRERMPGDINDCLLLELLAWFKKSFFSWVDSPPCETCGGTTHHFGSATPTETELMWGGSRVETHKCDTCGNLTRFPRYNHPGKLLDTRRGRCGEWANCFTLCCRALGFEARYILDWTDHVWTEVYSRSQKRWLHCDPCENVCDKPLLYEQGWGKNLTYILGFSKDDVQDVTWRYSAKHREVLARRQACREGWLVQVVHRLCGQKMQIMSEERKQELLQRLIVELVELISVKSPVAQPLPGRTTGSVDWRRERGELGKVGNASSPAVQQKQYTFRLLQEEKHSEVVHIKYSCSKDVYVRESAHGITTGKWYSCASGVGIFRKEESDWKMAYMAREEGADTGEISWKFDLTDEDLRINKLELKAQSTVFENGTVDWRICSDDNCLSVSGSQLQGLKTFDLEGVRHLTITALLRGGRGDVAWQHAQLFRQALDDTDYPFEVILHLG